MATVAECSEGGSVPGLVYVLDESDLARLDRYEGHPHSYERRRAWVHMSGVSALVWTYVKSGADLCAPADDYLRIIGEAYRMIGADDEHAAQLARAAGAPRPARRRAVSPGREWWTAAEVEEVEADERRNKRARAGRRLTTSRRRLLSAVDLYQQEIDRQIERQIRDHEDAPRVTTSDRPCVSLYTHGAFDADAFTDRVCDALRDFSDGAADAFLSDVLLSLDVGEDDEETIADLAARYVDLAHDDGGDTSDAPAWWYG